MSRAQWFVLFFLAAFAPAAFADVASVGTVLLKSAAGALASGVVGSLFGGGKGSAPAPAPAPVVAKPTAMPTPDDAAVAAAKKRSIAAQIQRQGRASTILTGDNEALG